MKWTPFRVVLGLNLVVIAGIYFIPYGGDSHGYVAFFWAILTILQIVLNLVLAAGAAGIEAVGGKKNGLPKAFLLSAGLTLLVSFPLCLLWVQYVR